MELTFTTVTCGQFLGYFKNTSGQFSDLTARKFTFERPHLLPARFSTVIGVKNWGPWGWRAVEGVWPAQWSRKRQAAQGSHRIVVGVENRTPKQSNVNDRGENFNMLIVRKKGAKLKGQGLPANRSMSKTKLVITNLYDDFC